MKMESWFDFAMLGHKCTVFGADRGEERWLRTNWEFKTNARSARPLYITVQFSHDAPQVAAPVFAAPETTFLPDTTLLWRQHGSRWWSTGSDEVGVELKLHADAVSITVWRCPGAAPVFPLETALQVAMCEALRTGGLSPLHAAVIARNGQATALVGKSGIGKSTSLMLALAQGWQPVAEDLSWFDPASARIYGWDRGVRLTEQAIAWLRPNWEADGWKRERDDKLFLSYDKLAPRKPTGVELTRIALLHRDSTRPSGWERLGLRESVRALCESVGLPLCRENRNYFADHVARLLARMEVMRLVVGNTPLPL